MINGAGKITKSISLEKKRTVPGGSLVEYT